MGTDAELSTRPTANQPEARPSRHQPDGRRNLVEARPARNRFRIEASPDEARLVELREVSVQSRHVLRASAVAGGVRRDELGFVFRIRVGVALTAIGRRVPTPSHSVSRIVDVIGSPPYFGQIVAKVVCPACDNQVSSSFT